MNASNMVPNADPCFDLAGDRAYSVFRLDSKGRILSAEVIPAVSDNHARSIAQPLLSGHSLELWERTRRPGCYPSCGTLGE